MKLVKKTFNQNNETMKKRSNSYAKHITMLLMALVLFFGFSLTGSGAQPGTLISCPDRSNGDPLVTSCATVVCPYDKYDDVNDETYGVVALAGRCWYKENVRGTLYQDGSTIPFAKPYYHVRYPNSDQYKIDCGLLYTYESAFPNGSGSQTLCPAGWSIPTAEEWALLDAYYAKDLKNTDYWLSPNHNTNSTTFNSHGAGIFNGTLQRFEQLFGYTAYWAFDDIQPDSPTAPGVVLRYHCNHGEMLPISKVDGISVRCIMDL
jgi:uncharacterized protein (TIGR02145 family)